jgi:hypothetical protein
MAKYALITHHDAGYQKLADHTWHDNKAEYCNIHGYDMVAKTGDWVSPVPAQPHLMTGFEKIHLARQTLLDHPEYEWVWWTGTDTMITNFSTRLEERCNNAYHFIVAVDINGINADSFLARNTLEGRQFLDAILALEPEYMGKFWDTEQRAIANLVGLPGTGDPGWPPEGEFELTGPYKDIVKVYPQRFMNSFNYHLYGQTYSHHRDKFGRDGNWQLGDWLIHWPAVPLDYRVELANFYKEHIIK